MVKCTEKGINMATYVYVQLGSDRYHPQNKLTGMSVLVGVEAAAVMCPSRQQRDLGRRYLSLLTSQPMAQHCVVLQLQHSN